MDIPVRANLSVPANWWFSIIGAHFFTSLEPNVHLASFVRLMATCSGHATLLHIFRKNQDDTKGHSEVCTDLCKTRGYLTALPLTLRVILVGKKFKNLTLRPVPKLPPIHCHLQIFPVVLVLKIDFLLVRHVS